MGFDRAPFSTRRIRCTMTAPSIAVEDVVGDPDSSPAEPECSRDKPEGAQEEPESSAGSTAEPADVVEEAPGSPAEQPEAAASKAGTKTAKVRCPKCSKELLPKTFNYSHNCDGSRKHRPRIAKFLKADPVLKPVEPEPTPAPRAKAAPRAKSSQKKPQTPPPVPEPEVTPNSPPHLHKVPSLDRRHTPDLRVRALMRQNSTARQHRFAGLMASTLPN